MAFDDGIERYALARPEIYDQLARCLAGFLIAGQEQFPISAPVLRNLIKKWSAFAQQLYHSDQTRQQEIKLLFEDSLFFSKISTTHQTLEPSDLFYQTTTPDRDQLLNLTIGAAIALGQVYTQLRVRLQQLNCQSEALEWHWDFVIQRLIQSGYAQAQSGRQRQLGAIGWHEYLEVALGKSNAFLDIGICIRDTPDRERFFQGRFNAGRYCEQLVDDVVDVIPDTREGVLGFLHLRLIEQGRLAERLLPYLQESPPVITKLMSVLPAYIDQTSLLHTHHNGYFVYQNPYIHVKRDAAGLVPVDPQTYAHLLREILANTPAELDCSLTSLVERRIRQYHEFCWAWQCRAARQSLAVLFESRVPLAFAVSFLQFIRSQRKALHAVYSGDGLAGNQAHFWLALKGTEWIITWFKLQTFQFDLEAWFTNPRLWGLVNSNGSDPASALVSDKSPTLD